MLLQFLLTLKKTKTYYQASENRIACIKFN